jgi:hypothetical protein
MMGMGIPTSQSKAPRISVSFVTIWLFNTVYCLRVPPHSIIFVHDWNTISSNAFEVDWSLPSVTGTLPEMPVERQQK